MTPYYDDGQIRIYCADSREFLPSIDSAFDAVIADPPYTFGMASTMHEGKAGGWGDMMNGALFYGLVLDHMKRLTHVRQGCAWVFNSWRSLPVLMRGAFDAQWPIESLLVWDKRHIGPGGQRGLRPRYEVAALFAHAQFALKNRSLPDIWDVPQTRETEHPAEKPVPLLERMVRESGAKRVLDPFCGSGSTLIACRNAGVEAVGVEIEERWCEVAVSRLKQRSLFAAGV